TMKVFAYARVSTKGQNLDRQLIELRKYIESDEQLFTDKCSGKNDDREGFKVLLKCLRKGDTLYIKSLDRLSRSKRDIKKYLEYFREEGITLKVLDIPTTLMKLDEKNGWITELINNLLLEVLSSIAEQERITILERQREGIEIAKREGKYKGRKPKFDINSPLFKEVYQLHK